MSSSPITTDAHLSQWTELSSREGDGLAVSLLWNPATDRVKVTVADSRLDHDIELHVDGADALSAFHHPFAFTAGRGSCFGEAACDSLDLQPLS